MPTKKLKKDSFSLQLSQINHSMERQKLLLQLISPFNKYSMKKRKKTKFIAKFCKSKTPTKIKVKGQCDYLKKVNE